MYEMLLPDVSFPLISQSEPSANEFLLIPTNEQSNVSGSVGKPTAEPLRLQINWNDIHGERVSVQMDCHTNFS